MVAILFSSPLGKATGSCSCKRTKFERASFARVIDEVASLVEEWGWSKNGVGGGYSFQLSLPWERSCGNKRQAIRQSSIIRLSVEKLMPIL